MIFPFVNWFWKRETKGVNWNWELSGHISEFEEAQKEYDARLAHFERTLDEAGLYRQYMELRCAAQRVNLLWDRVKFTQEMIGRIEKL